MPLPKTSTDAAPVGVGVSYFETTIRLYVRETKVPDGTFSDNYNQLREGDNLGYREIASGRIVYFDKDAIPGVLFEKALENDPIPNMVVIRGTMSPLLTTEFDGAGEDISRNAEGYSEIAPLDLAYVRANANAELETLIAAGQAFAAKLQA